MEKLKTKTMREIKFRAWTDNLKDGGEMYYQRLTDYFAPVFSPAGYGLFNPSLKIMQYTGLKDKNGKEIFEGDIVQRIFQEKEYQICEVKFEEGTFGVEDYDHAGIPSLWALRGRSHHFVIIGNIYENPELLTKN